MIRAPDHARIPLDGDTRLLRAELVEEGGEGEGGAPGVGAPIDNHGIWSHRLEEILLKPRPGPDLQPNAKMHSWTDAT